MRNQVLDWDEVKKPEPSKHRISETSHTIVIALEEMIDLFRQHGYV
jgi:hypothetical protein